MDGNRRSRKFERRYLIGGLLGRLGIMDSETLAVPEKGYTSSHNSCLRVNIIEHLCYDLQVAHTDVQILMLACADVIKSFDFEVYSPLSVYSKVDCDGNLDAHDSMGFGLPIESERSLMERVRQELKHELKQVRL
ncbi:hypothetical protein Tco_0417341 [Tanacetum coccineum]